MAQRARLVSAPDAPDYGWIEFSEPREGRDRSFYPGRDSACVFTLSLNGGESGVELDQLDPWAADMLGF
jgi:hypothetical protein